MTRKQKFITFKDHPMYGKHFAKLNQKEINFCLNWIEQRESLDFDTFCKQANRLFLDGSDKGIVRPKLENICQELISISRT